MTTEGLNKLRDEVTRIANDHGFTESTIGEDVALIHSEGSELLEDHRDGASVREVWYEQKVTAETTEGEKITYPKKFATMYPLTKSGAQDAAHPRKPCGIPSECADIIIRVLHFAGKHNIDIEKAMREKITYNATRPFKHGKIL